MTSSVLIFRSYKIHQQAREIIILYFKQTLTGFKYHNTNKVRQVKDFNMRLSTVVNTGATGNKRTASFTAVKSPFNPIPNKFTNNLSIIRVLDCIIF